MTDKKEPDQLEIEKIKLERFKVWGKIITVSITVLFGSALGVIINNSYQNRQLDLQATKYLGEFIDYALEKEDVKRLRFAKYFATLTPSKSLKKNWEKYYKDIIDDQGKLKDVKTQLEEEKSKKDSEKSEKRIRELESERERLKVKLSALPDSEKSEKKIRELESKLERLKVKLPALPEKSENYLTDEKAKSLYLDEDMKPRNYTINNFKKQKTINGEVVFDETTKLTWQQSGSEKDINYDGARKYIAKLNRDKFAGKGDWRLPTLEEAITLLEREKKSNGLFIKPVFDKR